MALSEKAQATRERILVAANELFYLHGYNATGLDKVIKSAGVTKGNFYYYFKSKEALAVASLDWHFSYTAQQMKEKLLDKNYSPIESLFSLLHLIADRQKDQHKNGHIQGCYFGNFTLELSTTSSAVRDKVKDIFKQYLTIIEHLLKQAKASNEIAPHIDPAEISAVILSQIEGAILLDKANQTPQSVDVNIKFIRQYLKSS